MVVRQCKAPAAQAGAFFVCQPIVIPQPPTAVTMSRPVRSQYEDFMRHVHTQGVLKTDRTGTGTRSVFGTKCGLT